LHGSLPAQAVGVADAIIGNEDTADSPVGTKQGKVMLEAEVPEEGLEPTRPCGQRILRTLSPEDQSTLHSRLFQVSPEWEQRFGQSYAKSPPVIC